MTTEWMRRAVDDPPDVRPLPRSAHDVIPAMPVPGPQRPGTWTDVAQTLGPLRWAWQPWLPCGFFTLLAARTGVGKSALALRLAACFTAGWPWPQGEPAADEPGVVLWCEAEGAQALNYDRAVAWGLDPACFLAPFPDPLRDVCLDDPEDRARIATVARRPDVRLVVVDSLSAALGARRDENSTFMLEPLRFLAELARDTGKPVLVTHHLRKAGLLDSGAPALDRLRGSGAIPQLARVVWLLDAPNAQTPAALRLSVVKSNLARFPAPLGLAFDDAGRLTFSADAPAEPEAPTEIEAATQWLLAALQGGPVKQTDLAYGAEAGGISGITLRRAKVTLGIKSEKRPDGWYWLLP